MTVTSQGSERRTQRTACEDGGREAVTRVQAKEKEQPPASTGSQETGLELSPQSLQEGTTPADTLVSGLCAPDLRMSVAGKLPSGGIWLHLSWEFAQGGQHGFLRHRELAAEAEGSEQPKGKNCPTSRGPDTDRLPTAAIVWRLTAGQGRAFPSDPFHVLLRVGGGLSAWRGWKWPPELGRPEKVQNSLSAAKRGGNSKDLLGNTEEQVETRLGNSTGRLSGHN